MNPHRRCYFNEALKASNDGTWRTLVGAVYQLRYSDSLVALVEARNADEYQRNCVDYEVVTCEVVLGEFTYDVIPCRFLCEVKSENYPAINISVETHSDVARGIPGWAFKPVEIHGQDLLTFFNCGTVFHAKLDDYRSFLEDNLGRWEAEIAEGNPTYRPFLQESHRDGRTWQSKGFTIPLEEVGKGLKGKASFYKLESPLLENAREAIAATSKANKGGLT